MCVRASVCASLRMCVCMCVRAHEHVYMCVCVCVRARACVCIKLHNICVKSIRHNAGVVFG